MKDPSADGPPAPRHRDGPGHVVVILNPEAGRGWRPGRVQTALRDRLPGAELAVTTGPGDARRMAAQAARAGADLVVAAGGDGLVGEVADGLLRRGGGPRLGILPLGTGNDLARCLGISRRLPAALRLLAEGTARPLDAGEMRPENAAGGSEPVRRFVNVVVAGFGGRLRLSTVTKRRWRGASYLREALRQLPDLRTHRVSLAVEGEWGEERFEESALMVVVANGRRMGGGIEVAPGASLDDGLLDVVVVPRLGPAALARALGSVMLRRRVPPELAWSRRARAVRLKGNPPLWLNADGEVLPPRPTAFRSLPGALRVIAPAAPETGPGS